MDKPKRRIVIVKASESTGFNCLRNYMDISIEEFNPEKGEYELRGGQNCKNLSDILRAVNTGIDWLKEEK